MADARHAGLDPSPGRPSRSPGERKDGKVVLPAAVVQAVKANFPKAEIDSATVEKEAGINLYDVEFKADQGEIEVAEDGTVMDAALVVTLNDVPNAAAEAIQRASPGAVIKRLEKSEIRAELKIEGRRGRIVKLAASKYVYEAELEKGAQKGEIQVAPDGKVVETLKWSKEAGAEEEKEEKEEGEEAAPTAKAPDLKILPSAFLRAFQAGCPKAVIKGTSRETDDPLGKIKK